MAAPINRFQFAFILGKKDNYAAERRRSEAEQFNVPLIHLHVQAQASYSRTDCLKSFLNTVVENK